MSAANLHLLLLADQRVEHEDEGKEVEVDGKADLEEHVGDRFSTGGRLWLSLTLVSTASLCRLEETQVTLTTQLSGETRPGLFPLIWENRMN